MAFTTSSTALSGRELALRPSAPLREVFSGALQISSLLDASGNLSQALHSGCARNLAEAFQQLNPTEQNQLRERWGRSLDELISLASERDATIFQHGLLEVGHRLEDGDQLELAGVVYSALVAGNSPRPPLNLRGGEGSVSASSESSPPLNLRGGQEGLLPVLTRAQARLNAINGVGGWRARLAFNLERLPTNATRWDMLFAMGGAGLVFRGVRLAATARWAASFESAFALNAAATSTAFLSETAAFTGLGRLFGTMAGNHYDWSAEGTFNEWAGGAAMLLGLKAMGGIFGNLSERWAAGETAFARVTRAFAPQAGMFSGIVLGNRLAELGGFHPERHGDTWLTDGLTTLLEFNIAGRLQRNAGGPGLTNLEGRMEAYTRAMGRGAGRRWGEVFSAAMVTPEGVQISEANQEDLTQTAVFSVQHGEGSIKSPAMEQASGAPEHAPPSPPHRIAYPSQIETLLETFLSAARQPGHNRGTRNDTVAGVYNDEEAIDRILHFQHRELFRRIPYVKVTEHSDEILLKPFHNEAAPSPEVLRKARESLGSRGAAGSIARQVLQVEIPLLPLKSAFENNAVGAQSRAAERSLGILSLLHESTAHLRHAVLLAHRTESSLIVRIPSSSLFERMLQTIFGKSTPFFQWIEGRAPRDDVMYLRSQHMSPVGIARDWVWLDDIQDWVPPNLYWLHDAVGHASIDVAAESPAYPLSKRIYDWIQRRVPEGDPRVEPLLNGLADGKLASPLILKPSLFDSLRGLFEERFAAAIAEPNLHWRSLMLEEIRAFLEGLHDMSLIPQNSAPEAWQSLSSAIYHESNRLRQWQGVSNIEYTTEHQARWGRFLKITQDPKYLTGERQKILSRRPPMRDTDALYLALALDYARRVPNLRVEEHDAHRMLIPLQNQPAPQDTKLLTRALARLQNEHGDNPEAHRMLEFNYLDYSEIADSWNNLPHMNWVSTMPFWNDAMEHLKRRVHFGELHPNLTKMRIISPSLFEILLQEGNPEAPIHLLPVAGIISREDTRRLRVLRLPPLGLMPQAFYFSEFGGEIHPWLFAQHDMLDHASRDATVPTRFAEIAGRIVPRMSDKIAASRVGEAYLNELVDLPFFLPESASPSTFLKRLLNPLWAQIERYQHTSPSAAKQEHRRQLIETIEAVDEAMREEFTKTRFFSKHKTRFIETLYDWRRILDENP